MRLELDWDDDAFVEETLENKPPSFFAQHVKALCITGVHPVETLRLMSMCEGVVNFACWAGTDTGESAILPALSSFRRLQRLTMNFEMVFDGPPNFSLPLFAEITHLEVLDLPSWWDQWTGFELLSNLTHLAFYSWDAYEETTDVLRHILLNCKSLQFLVFVYVEFHFPSDSQRLDDELDDPRVVFIPVNFPITKDWEDGARGGTQGVWVRAEKKVAEKQRRGESVNCLGS